MFIKFLYINSNFKYIDKEILKYYKLLLYLKNIKVNKRQLYKYKIMKLIFLKNTS